MWPLTETCWKKTYSMPSASMRLTSWSMCAARPGALRASSSVAGAGAIRGVASTPSTPRSARGVTVVSAMVHSLLSEQLQVAVDLPLGDLLVGLLPLAPLAADEVVDVVLVAPPAQRGAQHVVALELARRVEQVGGQDLDAQLGALRLVGLVEVQRVRLARVQPALDAVQSGGEHGGGGEVGVARAVDRAVLDAPRAGDAQHLRAVVVSVADVRRRPRRPARRRAD